VIRQKLVKKFLDLYAGLKSNWIFWWIWYLKTDITKRRTGRKTSQFWPSKIIKMVSCWKTLFINIFLVYLKYNNGIFHSLVSVFGFGFLFIFLCHILWCFWCFRIEFTNSIPGVYWIQKEKHNYFSSKKLLASAGYDRKLVKRIYND
jgi:hypothetical protein